MRTLLTLLLLLLTLPLAAQTKNPDLAHQDRAIHWPAAFSPAVAPVFTHNELLIHASCTRVWARFTQPTDWPTWFPLVKDVTLDDPSQPLAKGTVLHLKIFGSPILSRIDEFVPDSRLNWFPQGLDEPTPLHYHAWHFIPRPGGCLAVTEETGIGPNDIKDPAKMEGLIRRAHDLWLAGLRYTSEQ